MLLLNHNECAYIYIFHFLLFIFTHFVKLQTIYHHYKLNLSPLVFNGQVMLNPIQVVFSAFYGDFKRTFPCLLRNKLPMQSDGSSFTKKVCFTYGQSKDHVPTY